MPRYESVYTPTNSKKDRRFCCKFTYLFVVPKQGAVEALPFPAGGNPSAIICPKGKLTNDGIWRFSENLCRGYAALRVRLRPHQYENGTQNCSEFTYPYHQNRGAVEALPFPASGSPTAKICPSGKLTNDGIWEFWKNPCRGYAALRVRLRPTNTKTARIIALNSFIRTTKTRGGRGFAVSRKRESYGKNLPEGQIDERRHLEIFGKSVSRLCRVTSPFTPPPIQKRHA